MSNRKGQGLGQRRPRQETIKDASESPWDRGEHLRRERIAARFSQVDLAKHVGVSPGLIVRLETNRSDPALSVVKKLAQGLGISVMDLLGDDRPTVPPALVRTLRWEAGKMVELVEDLQALVEGRSGDEEGHGDGAE